jgi:hypothetical protein
LFKTGKSDRLSVVVKAVLCQLPSISTLFQEMVVKPAALFQPGVKQIDLSLGWKEPVLEGLKHGTTI